MLVDEMGAQLLGGDDAVVPTNNNEPSDVGPPPPTDIDPSRKVTVPPRGTSVLHVCVDVEHTNPTHCLSEMFEVAVQPYAVEIVGLDTSVQFIDNTNPVHVEHIRPSLEFGDCDFYWATTALTGCRREDVQNCRTFNDVMADIEKRIDEVRQLFRCTDLLLSGWSFYAVDHHVLVQNYHRHNRPWPATWRWGWDAYRSVLAKQGNRFKITRPSTKNPNGVPASSGNQNMKISGIYEAITGTPLSNHHQAADDVNATVTILKQQDVWKLRRQGLKLHNGWYALADRHEDCLKMLKDSTEQLYPALPPGWIGDPDDAAPIDNTTATSTEAGPTSRAATKKRRLAEYWDLHHRDETMKRVAKYTNYYAGGAIYSLCN